MAVTAYRKLILLLKEYLIHCRKNLRIQQTETAIAGDLNADNRWCKLQWSSTDVNLFVFLLNQIPGYRTHLCDARGQRMEMNAVQADFKSGQPEYDEYDGARGWLAKSHENSVNFMLVINTTTCSFW